MKSFAVMEAKMESKTRNTYSLHLNQHLLNSAIFHCTFFFGLLSQTFFDLYLYINSVLLLK